MNPLSFDFFAAHFSHLIQLSPEVHGSWRKSWIMGVSCWFYSFPGILCFVLLLNQYYYYYPLIEGILYILTAVNSFLSDYVYIGIAHYSHALDRIFATASALSMLMKLFIVTFTLCEFLVFIMLWIIALSMLSKSRKSTAQNEFVLHHFLWHLVGSLGMCWILWIQHLKYEP